MHHFKVLTAPTTVVAVAMAAAASVSSMAVAAAANLFTAERLMNLSCEPECIGRLGTEFALVDAPELARLWLGLDEGDAHEPRHEVCGEARDEAQAEVHVEERNEDS